MLCARVGKGQRDFGVPGDLEGDHLQRSQLSYVGSFFGLVGAWNGKGCGRGGSSLKNLKHLPRCAKVRDTNAGTERETMLEKHPQPVRPPSLDRETSPYAN